MGLLGVYVYSVASHQEYAEHFGFKWSGHFHWLKTVRYNEHELLAELRAPAEDEIAGYELHPGLLDSGFQAALAWLHEGDMLEVPLAIGRIQANKQLPRWVHIRKTADGKQDIRYIDAHGFTTVHMEQFTTRAISSELMQKMLRQQTQERLGFYVNSYEPYAVPDNLSLDESEIYLYASDKIHKQWKQHVNHVTTHYRSLDAAHDTSGQHVVYVYEERLDDLLLFMQTLLAHQPLSFTLVLCQAYREHIHPLQTAAAGQGRSKTEACSPWEP